MKKLIFVVVMIATCFSINANNSKNASANLYEDSKGLVFFKMNDNVNPSTLITSCNSIKVIEPGKTSYNIYGKSIGLHFIPNKESQEKLKKSLESNNKLKFVANFNDQTNYKFLTFTYEKQ
jgi:hypothetical protein